MKRTIALTLTLLAGGGLFGLASTQTTAHASSYVRYYQNIKNQTATVTNRNAPVYTTGSLRHRAGTMKNYGTQVEQYYAAHVRKQNGKASIYYKFRIGKKTGWVWHGYLKPVSTTSNTATNGTTPTTAFTNNSTTVENTDWRKTSASGTFSASATLMQLFPKTIYSSTLFQLANGYINIDDGSDRTNYFDWHQTELNQAFGNGSTVTPTLIDVHIPDQEPFTKAAIDAGLTKAGYDATARAKFAGWYIGGFIEPNAYADEGASGGDIEVVLVPSMVQ